MFFLRFLQFRLQLCLCLRELAEFGLEFAALLCDIGSLLLGRFAGLSFFGELFG